VTFLRRWAVKLQELEALRGHRRRRCSRVRSRHEGLLPVVTLVLGFLLQGGYSRFTRQSQLTGRISAELDVLDKLPVGTTREQLREHIGLQVRYLVAHEDQPNVEERLQRRWALGYLLIGVVEVAQGLSINGTKLGTWGAPRRLEAGVPPVTSRNDRFRDGSRREATCDLQR
jgi:hypothetical protein